MQILVCAFTYPPNRDGVSAAAEAMANGLCAHGHKVSVATEPVQARSGSPSNIANIPVYEFEFETRDPVRRAEETARFQEWLLQQSFDIVVCHCWTLGPTAAVAALGRRLPARKVLVSHGLTVHLIDWSPKPFWGLGPWLRNLPFLLQIPVILRKFDWVTVLSDRKDFGRFLDHRLARLTGYKRISVIPNGTYPKRFAVDGSAFRSVFGIEEKVFFLCVANYFRHKNQEMAIRSFRRAALSDSALVFIGSELGGYGRKLQALDRELSASQPNGRILFLENVSQDMISAAYVASSVFITSATTETQPIVLIEAMAAGKPWVSTDTGCVRELPGGLVISSEKDLADAMRQLAGDQVLRERLGQEGRRASEERFNWEANVATYDALFRRLVAE